MAEDLERQKQAVDNTAKVTQAMQTISTVKLQRARERLNSIKPYTDNVEEMMRDIAEGAQSNNELLVGRDELNRVALCTITSDRGLAGAFNANVLRLAMQFRAQQGVETTQVVTGNKAVEFFRFQRMNLEERYSGFSDSPTYEKAREIGNRLVQLFEDGEVDEVHLFFNRFRNALVQFPTRVRLLPATSEEDGNNGGGEENEEEESGGNPFEFIPGPDELLERLIPRYVETLMFRALVESAAGEHGARMSAMKSATDAANDMSEQLTMQINKQRQAAITQEIVEISAAMEALGG